VILPSQTKSTETLAKDDTITAARVSANTIDNYRVTDTGGKTAPSKAIGTWIVPPPLTLEEIEGNLLSIPEEPTRTSGRFGIMREG